jgi:hypothetical protein
MMPTSIRLLVEGKLKAFFVVSRVGLFRLKLIWASGAPAEATPEETADEVGGSLSAALDLAGLDIDVEAGDEAGDSLVSEAALAEDLDLAGEERGDFGPGVAFGVGAGGFAEFAGGDGDLIDGVGFRVDRHGKSSWVLAADQDADNQS